MKRVVKRGFVPTDAKEFGPENKEKLAAAVQDTCYLLDRGFENSGAITFIGNHYQLTERQRLALMRGLAAGTEIQARKDKELKTLSGRVLIDGFNTLITLEVALSGSLVLACNDGTLRDLAGLHGSFRIVDKTVAAADLLLRALGEFSVTQAVIYLDRPVSNSGRLKQLLATRHEKNCAYNLDLQLLPDVDKQLTKGEQVITSDSIILNNCTSWFNLNRYIIEKYIPQAWLVKIAEL